MVKADFDPFPPSAGEVVVEVAGCGVCHTDLGFYYDGVRVKSPLPLTLGHEISGRVVAACTNDTRTAALGSSTSSH